MYKLGSPKDRSIVHMRDMKIVAYCNNDRMDVWITDDRKNVTCHRCVGKMLDNGLFKLKVRDDFQSQTAYVKYLYRFTPANGVTKGGLANRLRSGIDPFTAATAKSDSKPKQSHYYKGETYVRETARRVMKLNQEKMKCRK